MRETEIAKANEDRARMVQNSEEKMMMEVEERMMTEEEQMMVMMMMTQRQVSISLIVDDLLSLLSSHHDHHLLSLARCAYDCRRPHLCVAHLRLFCLLSTYRFCFYIAYIIASRASSYSY